MVTTSSGSQATSISEYVLSAILAQEKRGQQLAVANPKMWIETRERVRNRPVGGLEGKVLGMLGAPGGKLGQFRSIHGLACQDDHTVWVADQFNWRIQKITIE